MGFARYTDCALNLATDLVNTLSTSDGVDRLTDERALSDFLAEHDFSGVSSVTRQDVDDVRALRDRLKAVFFAQDALAAAAQLNALIAQAGALPRLTDHDGEPLHLHYEAPGASLPDRVAVSTAMGLAIVIATEGFERIKHCAKPGCEDVFVDVTKNRGRRFCDSATCGNAYHVAEYRRRRRDASVAPKGR